MAKNNAGDILTCDWNPVIGCEPHSAGCRDCWYLGGIFPWQQRLGTIPAGVSPHEPFVFEKRLEPAYLKPRTGIVGVCQHGDLFWEKIPDTLIDRALDTIDLVAPHNPTTRYLLWTKRAERMSRHLAKRYPAGVPAWYGCTVTMESQAALEERMPWLADIRGTRVAMFEPLLGPVAAGDWMGRVDWVVAGSETGSPHARPMDPAWARPLRDAAALAGKPFFIKQVGRDHRKPDRMLDGRSWDGYPADYVK